MSYFAEFGPPRPDEPVLYCRWALSRTTLVPSDTPGLWEAICMINFTQWVATPRLSWSFVAIDPSSPIFDRRMRPEPDSASEATITPCSSMTGGPNHP